MVCKMPRSHFIFYIAYSYIFFYSPYLLFTTVVRVSYLLWNEFVTCTLLYLTMWMLLLANMTNFTWEHRLSIQFSYTYFYCAIYQNLGGKPRCIIVTALCLRYHGDNQAVDPYFIWSSRHVDFTWNVMSFKDQSYLFWVYETVTENTRLGFHSTSFHRQLFRVTFLR